MLRSQLNFTDFLEALCRTAEMTESKTISDAKRPLSTKIKLLIEHVIEANAEAFENDENAIQDHFAEEKELEIQRLEKSWRSCRKCSYHQIKESLSLTEKKKQSRQKEQRSKDYSNCLKL